MLGWLTPVIDYRGFLLTVRPHGSGFRIEIRRPGAQFALPPIPLSQDKLDLPKLIADAKRFVDAYLDGHRNG